MVKVRPLERRWTERLKVKQLPSGQWVLEDTVTNAWYCFGDKRPSPDDVKEGIRCLTHYQMTDEDREALRSQQMLPGLLGPPDEPAPEPNKVTLAQAMNTVAAKLNEAWLAKLSYEDPFDQAEKAIERRAAPKPKTVYTASAPGRCKECGLKTVLTRNEKDICQACDTVQE